MATPAHRLIQDQNINLLYNGGTTSGLKTDIAKADKKKGLGGRKALNDISNSRKTSVLQPTKKDTNIIAIEKDPFAGKGKLSKAPDKGKLSKAPDKGKTGNRKALTDLTNSVKPPSSQQVTRVGRKLNIVAEENVPSCMVDERFLHNHQECIKAQMKAVDVDYFLKSVGLNNDISARPSAIRAVQTSSKKHLEMKEISEEELLEDQVPNSPACQSPKSPKPPYADWDEDNVSDLMMIATPKLLYP